MFTDRTLLRIAAGILTLSSCSMAGVIVTQTVTGSTLTSALGGGGGLTVTSATVANGAATQFGTYTNFTSAPVTIGNGVVLSTGSVLQVGSAFQSSGSSPSTSVGSGGTSEFSAYGPGHISNFTSANDVASLLVNFTLAAPSQIGFDFVFGSVEYPVFTSSFTDSFVAFLDGTAAANQIVFDTSNNAVQVGSSFASSVVTNDTNTAFSSPHGLLRLQTFTVNTLSAGNHTIRFEVGDVNDTVLDSAVFVSNLRAGVGTGGTTPTTVPEPASVMMISGALIGATVRFRKKFTYVR